MAFAIKQEYLPHYTFDDYCQWEGRWEIIEGVPYAMSPLPSGRHQWISGKLFTQFHEQLKNCGHCNVSMPMDWKVNETTVVQPDLFIACFDFKNMNYITQAPAIVVEVLSPSTRNKDIFVKNAVYRQQGVQYYVLIDPENNTYKVLQLSAADYNTAQSGQEGVFTFELPENCCAEIDFGKLWD